MELNHFQAYQTAMELSQYAYGHSKLVGVYASSSIKIYPFQMVAALFALRSPYLKGVILCDEGGLGKTVEALLAVAQKWYEGKQRILIITPNHLLKQWEDMLEEKFSIPWEPLYDRERLKELSAEGNPFLRNAVLITSYDFALENCAAIKEIQWDTVVFEEASRLSKIYTGKSKEAVSLKEAAGNAFKILVTPTPIEMSIMDIYGLIYFIDEAVLPDREWFYKRYFRKPENYGELTDRISRYCFRTLRTQAKQYMKLPERIPVALEYRLTKKEKELYALLEAYLKKPVKKAFPQMDAYDLTLMLTKIASSSSFALHRTLVNIEKRLWAMEKCDEELAEIRRMKELAGNIKENAKGKELLFLLKKLFPLLKKAGGNRKALIFTENRLTQEYLKEMLLDEGYYALIYNGSKSKDYEIIAEFENTGDILICTEVAASGLNLQFCSLVINYDWSYNALEMEQRINRCHRQDQENDVVVVNFINPENFADVRTIELMNKRIRQFDGIIGMSDEIVGKPFVSSKKAVEYIAKAIRPAAEIEAEYRLILEGAKERNIAGKEAAEAKLFTTFDEEIAGNVEITPQYIEEKIEEINNRLWDLTRYFFKGNPGFSLNEETRTVSAFGHGKSPFTGIRLGRDRYSMLDKSLPKSGWHTITGTLAKNIIREILWRGIPQEGTVTVEGAFEKCHIGFYEIAVKPEKAFFAERVYHTLAGVTESGRQLSEKECLEIMALPTVNCQVTGIYHGGKHGKCIIKESLLDAFVEREKYLRKAIKELDTENAAAIEKTVILALEKKAALSRDIEALRLKIKASGKTEAATKMEEVKLKKQLNLLTKELKQKEQTVFMESIRIDAEKEKRIEEIRESAKLGLEVKREFLVKVISR